MYKSLLAIFLLLPMGQAIAACDPKSTNGKVAADYQFNPYTYQYERVALYGYSSDVVVEHDTFIDYIATSTGGGPGTYDPYNENGPNPVRGRNNGVVTIQAGEPCLPQIVTTGSPPPRGSTSLGRFYVNPYGGTGRVYQRTNLSIPWSGKQLATCKDDEEKRKKAAAYEVYYQYAFGGGLGFPIPSTITVRYARGSETWYTGFAPAYNHPNPDHLGYVGNPVSHTLACY